jgi:sigma-B regulation protein RsbU (phosphoserine phosphatase)
MSPSPKSTTAAAFDLLPLLEFSNIVNSSVDLKFILNSLLLTALGKTMAGKGMVLLRREQDAFEVITSRGMPNFSAGTLLDIKTPPRIPITIRRTRTDRREWLSSFAQSGMHLVIPIINRRSVVGMLVLGERIGGAQYSRIDLKLIESLASLSGAAVEKASFIQELKDTNRQLDRKFQELNTLFELSKEFNVGLDANRVIRLLTFSLLGQVGVSRYLIVYETNAQTSVVASKGDFAIDIASVVLELKDIKGGALTADLMKKRKYAKAAAQLTKAGLTVVIPMHIQSKMKGVMFLGEKLRRGEYNKGDLEFLYALSNLACVSIENARLFQDALEKQRMEDELAIAREIQQGLLPRSLPLIAGFDVAAANISSKQVGGDYYDVVPRGINEFVIAIGDVSGKGTGAALLMANVQAAMRALIPMSLPLPETTARMNDLTTENTGQGNFITFVWGVLNASDRTFRYVNAGHNPPLLVRRNGTIEHLDIGGIILGMMKTTTPYGEGIVTLQSGDVLFLFTDGVSEAMDSAGNDFTDERLIDVVRELQELSAHDIIEGVRKALDDHTKGTPQSDDITMLVLRAL